MRLSTPSVLRYVKYTVILMWTVDVGYLYEVEFGNFKKILRRAGGKRHQREPRPEDMSRFWKIDLQRVNSQKGPGRTQRLTHPQSYSPQ